MNLSFFSTKVDGINIDTEYGGTGYYPEFVKKLRQYMDMSADKKYFLTASPTCTYPNSFIGKAYEQYSNKFDFLFLDTNEFTCNFNNVDQLNESLTKWLAFTGPEIFLTIPADERATSDRRRYLTRNEVIETIQVSLSTIFPCARDTSITADRKRSSANLIVLKLLFGAKTCLRSTIKVPQLKNLKSLLT